MAEHTDLLVVGAGPAGLSAAIEAATAGLKVIVVDENQDCGGQIYRQFPHAFRPAPSYQPDMRGRTLIERSRNAGVAFRFGCTAWGLFEPGVMEVADASGCDSISARSIVIATGAYDRAVPVPGWTLPGVFTVGGAQALLKSQRVLAGRRVLLAGVGPLLLVVASQLHEAGADVLAVAEPVAATRAAGALLGLMTAPHLVFQGIGYRWSLVKGRVPWLSRTVLVRIEGRNLVQAAVVARADTNWMAVPGTERTFEVDVVCVGYGLVPSIQLSRICGCAVCYDEPSQSWVPIRNQDMESSVSGIYIAGDGAGIAGAVVAADEGAIAGLAAARERGALSPSEAARRMEPRRRQLAKLERFRRTMDRIFRLRPGLFTVTTPETTVCRCEEVTLDDLEQAAQDGAATPSELKAFTRCGMGPCQGRMCAPAVNAWLATRLGMSPHQIGLAPAAPPAKPVVELGAL